jgi:hypothetical protein
MAGGGVVTSKMISLALVGTIIIHFARVAVGWTASGKKRQCSAACHHHDGDIPLHCRSANAVVGGKAQK